MSNGPVFPALERSAFFNGQRLLAEDLGSISTYQRELRWLHNRTMHGWGIALGLDVIGEDGGRAVRIEPGYAIDCRGRDIILPRAVEELQVPPVATGPQNGRREFYLTVSYRDDDELDAETRRGSCEGGGAVRRKEQPLVRWCDPLASAPSGATFRPGFDILLATVLVSGCQLAGAPDPARRRSLNAPHRPIARGGRTGSASTVWEFFPADGAAAVGVGTYVDTTAGRFQSTPAYKAQLVGSWTLPLGGVERLASGWTQVANPTSQGFDFRVYLPRNVQAGGSIINHSAIFTRAGLDAIRSQANWHVHWIGVEG